MKTTIDVRKKFPKEFCKCCGAPLSFGGTTLLSMEALANPRAVAVDAKTRRYARKYIENFKKFK